MKSFQQLKKELDANKITGFYVFTGEEKEVMNKYIKRIDANAKTINSAKQLMMQIENRGLFNRGGTYVLYNDEEIQEIGLKKLLGKLQQDNLILVYDSIDKRKKFFKDADKYITEFKKFNDKQLMQHIKKQFPDLTNEMAFVIVKCCNNDIGRIETELHKLKFVQEISFDVLEDLLTPQLEDKIFEMIDGVAKRNAETSFSIYYDLIELKESPIKIISLLYTKFKQLFLVQSYFNLSDNEIMEKTSLNYGQVKFTRKLVGKFTLSELLKMLKEIQHTEVGIKTGKIDVNLGTENLILQIFNPT